MQNLDIVEINDEQAYNAKLLASQLSTPQKRKRGMIDMLGISCAVSYLQAKRIRIDTKRSVYKIPLLYEEFKISDIYYGNYRIDVITLYKEKTIKIPKIHVDMDILPHFYFIVQIGSKIKEAKMVGFIDSKQIAKSSHDSKYYYPTLDMLIDINKFHALTQHSIASKTLLGKHIDCMGLFLKFIDNDLSSIYKRQMINHLMNCDSCRSCFIDMVEFERLANNIRFYPELAKKYESKIVETSAYLDVDPNKDFVSFEEGIKNAKISEIKQKQETFIDIPKEEDEIKQIEPEINIIKENKKETKVEIIEDNKTVQMFDLVDENKTKKGVIDSIFGEIKKFELPQIKTVSKVKTKRIAIIFLLLLFVLGSFMLISFKGTNDIIEENNEIENFEEFDDEIMGNDYNTIPMPPSKPLLREPTMDEFLNRQPQSIVNYSPTITKLSWEAPESLVKKGDYIKFLQLVGKNVKLNLQNDLLLVKDFPVNKVVKVDIIVAGNGNVNSVKMTKSSGSSAIDASIKKVVMETLAYMKPPSHGLGIKTSDVTLVIELN